MKRYMSFCIKYLSCIIHLFGMAMICSSCITINKLKPASIEEVSKYDNRRIIIKTFDGRKYKLNWIEEQGDSIVSKKNTKRIRIDMNEPKRIMVEDRSVSLDSAINYSGIVQVKTENGTYKFLDIYVEGGQIIGLKRTGKEVLPVAIHKDQIEKIKVKNKGASAALTSVVGIVILSGIALALIFTLAWG